MVFEWYCEWSNGILNVFQSSATKICYGVLGIYYKIFSVFGYIYQIHIFCYLINQALTVTLQKKCY